MLEKPDLADEKITGCLWEAFGLRIAQLGFLPLGADRDTAVYRALDEAGTAYFVKLRSGSFADICVTLPKALSDLGVGHIISPLAAQNGRLWAGLEPFKLILYPFVEGRSGYEVPLTERGWVELGAALKSIHTAPLPPGVWNGIPRETYSPRWREAVREFVERAGQEACAEPVAAQLAGQLRRRRAQILELVGRAERLARALQARPAQEVACHADLHAGNLLIDARGDFWIVDWDTPIRALKERDLMYAGGGQFGRWRTPAEEEALFYQGYGAAPVDAAALAYYRYERIIQDLAVECEQIFLPGAGLEDRRRELEFFQSNFLPGGVLEIARRADRSLTSQE